MSDPVSASQGAPLFGGLSGYRRDTPSGPTSVPGGLPAFRGRANTPGSPVKTPAIRTSYNRQDRGTNVCIPYSRVVPFDDLRDAGRMSPGDVVFCSRFTCGSLGHDIARPLRLVGVDWMNRQLGGRPEYDKNKHEHQWVVGYNVLLGASIVDPGTGEGADTNTDEVEPADFVADNWRDLKFLREWAMDGVVLSNDEPGVFDSQGTHDGQVFNVAVQGVCPVNNGYVDFKGDGVESNHRGMSVDKTGYHDNGEPFVHNDFMTTFGGPYYNSYPLQMFDRKLRPMSTVYVGLVCTKRQLTAKYRELLNAQTPGLTIDSNVQSFYTFHFGYFSDNQTWSADAVIGVGRDIMGGGLNTDAAAEPPVKKSRQHYEDAAVGATFDPFVGLSDREWGGMVGAWKVGKVLDIAAQVKDQYYGGPVDTAERITVSVDIQFLDWRALRRTLNRPTLGGRIPGAAPWNATLGFSDAWTPALEAMMAERSVRGSLTAAQGGDGSGAFDQGFVMKWPTEYTQLPARDFASGEGWIEHTQRIVGTLQANAPKDPMTLDEAIRGDDAQRAAYDTTNEASRNAYVRRRAEVARAKLFRQALVDGVAPWDGKPETRAAYEKDLGLPAPVYADLTVDVRSHDQQGYSVDGTSTTSQWAGGALVGGSAVPPVKNPDVAPGEHEFDPLWDENEQWAMYLAEINRSKNYRLAGINAQAAGLRQRVIGARRQHYKSNAKPDATFVDDMWAQMANHAQGGARAISQNEFVAFLGDGVNDAEKLRAFAPLASDAASLTRGAVVNSLYRYMTTLDLDHDGDLTKVGLAAWLDPEKAEQAAVQAVGPNRPFLALSSRELQLARDVPTPMEDGTLPKEIVMPPSAPMAPPPVRSTAAAAGSAAPRGKGKAVAAQPNPKSAATSKTAAAASVASVVMAPTVTPMATPTLTTTTTTTPTPTAKPASTAKVAAPPRPVGGVRRARSQAEGGASDVFNSIFGGATTAPFAPTLAASSAEDPTPSPSVRSEGSDGGSSGGPTSRGGRVRRSRDGR